MTQKPGQNRVNLLDYPSVGKMSDMLVSFHMLVGMRRVAGDFASSRVPCRESYSRECIVYKTQTTPASQTIFWSANAIFSHHHSKVKKHKCINHRQRSGPPEPIQRRDLAQQALQVFLHAENTRLWRYCSRVIIGLADWYETVPFAPDGWYLIVSPSLPSNVANN